MKRTVAVLFAFAVAAGVVAAPPPKETPENKLRRLFGETYDPEKDCTFSLDGSKLRIKVPGSPHRFTPGYEKETSSAPRTRREVTGDFDVRVKIVSVTKPNPKSDGLAMTAAGLFVGTTDDKFITISRYTTPADDGDGVNPQFLFQHHLPTGGGSGLGLQANDQKENPVIVRLVREGNKVTGYTSSDGLTWTPRGTQHYDWPDKVYVGMFASHGVNHAVEAVLDDFKVIVAMK